jgi:DNA-binding Lrp family transcriptional regulator
MPKQEEKEKYTPNNSFMGMQSQPPKVVFFGRGKVGADSPPEEERLVPETSLVSETSLVPEAPPIETSLVNSTSKAQQKTRLVSDTSLTSHTTLPQNLWEALSVQNGHNKLPNAVVDQLCRHLTPNEQAIFNQLFRLSYGFGKDRCKIGLPKLAERSNMSESAVQKAVKGLQAKGLILKEGADFGRGREQGTVYSLPFPTSLVHDTSLVRETSLVRGTSNKKELKDSNKSEMAPPDYKNCLDCQGSGFWYPEGNEKGVAKCKHERLGK